MSDSKRVSDETLDTADCLEELLSYRAVMPKVREALEHYSKPTNWEQFISDGNIFEEIEGDPLMAFNDGEDSLWSEAKTVIELLDAILGTTNKEES